MAVNKTEIERSHLYTRRMTEIRNRDREVSLVHEEDDRDKKDGSSQENVGQGKVVPGSTHHLHCLVGIATLEQDCVVEDSSPQGKVKDILVPLDHRIDAWTHIVELHSSIAGRRGE